MIKDIIKEFRRIRASELRANPRNWRRHPKAQREAMEGILAEIGFAGAVLAYETDTGLELIDGHLRTEIAADEEVPVLILDTDEAGAAKILATFDPVAAMAEADAEALGSVLADIQTESQAVADMLTRLAEEAGVIPNERFEVSEDEPPEVPAESPVVPGDIWILGEHRLLCGDSTDGKLVERFMGGHKADMLLLDPPYGVSYKGKTKDKLEIENDDIDESDLTDLVLMAFDVAQQNCRPGSYWYATVPAGPLHLIFAQDWKNRGILRQIMVWAKDSLVMGHSEYHYQHEPILFGWMQGGTRHKNKDRTRTTLWKYDRPKANREHPTMKPVALWAQAIQDGSREGEIVYDPFCGSGTSVVACQQLKRRCFCVELSPIYCSVILDRWSALSGADPVHAETGVSWSMQKKMATTTSKD